MIMHGMYPFRVFISHASEDAELVERIAVVLQQIGLTPIWDKGIPGGVAFDQEICRRIATAHLFMPLLTCPSPKLLGVLRCAPVTL